MRATWDKTIDAAYIYLADEIAPGAATYTHGIAPVDACGAMINLDFDASGTLLGIEVIGATTTLPKEVLDQAEVIDE